MTERNGLTVHVRRMPNGKHWVWVATKADGSPIAFRDWFDQIVAITYCEVLKYGGDPDNPLDWERWGGLPKDFLQDCFKYGVTYEELRDKHGLPR